jgi:poly(hydroxyalkanoate) granule-associated protein
MNKPKLKRKASGASAKPSTASMKSSLMESAQQIWMAGVGAFQRAQGEGGKLFETLVKEGSSLEQKTRRFATGKVDEARDAVEATVAQVKERAADTWDRLETVFETRVSRALGRLGVPGRDEMQALLDRVEELNRSVRKMGDSPEIRSASRKISKSATKARRGVRQMVEAAEEAQQAAATAVKKSARRVAKAASKKPRSK